MGHKKNTRLIENAYQSPRNSEVEPLLNSFAEDVVWELPEMENVPFSGVWRGRDGVRKFFAKVFELQDVLEFEPEEYFTRVNKVAVLGHFTMRIKSTRREFSSLWSHVWTVKDDKVSRFYEYVDTAVVSKAHTEAKSTRKVA